MRKKIESLVDDITSILVKEYKGISDNSLLGGTSGILLYFFYLYRYTNDNKWKDICIELIEKHIADLENGNFNGYTLENGLVGICWTLIHINEYDKDIFEGNDIEEYLAELDSYIIESSINDFNHKRFDFMHGGLGTLYYFLEKKKNTREQIFFFSKVVNFFKIHQKSSGGWSIHDYFGTIIENENFYDLGLAHGNSSILVLLSKLYEKNYLQNEIKEMVYKNLAWLSKYKIVNGKSVYPNIIENGEIQSGILGWCYGDLSMSNTLLHLSKTFNDDKIYYEAIDLVENCMSRIKEVQTYPVHSICHGTSGTAFILNQIEKTYNLNTSFATKIALVTTLEKAYSFSSSHPYQNRKEEEEDIYKYSDELSFLDGLSGIGLVFLSFISDIEPNWKKCLLV